jgi:Skp family chaperone for outer membrane proteins
MYIKKLIFCLIIFFSSQSNILAETTHFLDFKLILNQSDAGKKAQNFLKNKLSNGFKDLKKKEANILEEEKKLIEQKKIVSTEEYKKKVTNLRNKVSSLQKERNSFLATVAKQRAKAKSELLKNLNPIVKNYMEEKNIKIVIDKKNVLLGDESLNITKDIMTLLNNKIKSIKLD